jgi:hypothetical protein
MKNTLIKLLSIFLAYFISFSGLIMFMFFFVNELSVLSFLVGLFGYIIALKPGVDEWTERLENIFK